MTLKLAERWGLPPWGLDLAHLPPLERRWANWALEAMHLEETYG